MVPSVATIRIGASRGGWHRHQRGREIAQTFTRPRGFERVARPVGVDRLEHSPRRCRDRRDVRPDHTLEKTQRSRVGLVALEHAPATLAAEHKRLESRLELGLEVERPQLAGALAQLAGSFGPPRQILAPERDRVEPLAVLVQAPGH